MSRKYPEHEVSSGNVFADLALPDSDAPIAKAVLAQQIAEAPLQRQLTQAAAASTRRRK